MYAKDYNTTVYDVIKRIKDHAVVQHNNQVTIASYTYFNNICMTIINRVS